MSIRPFIQRRMPLLLAYLDPLTGHTGETDRAAERLAAGDRDGAYGILSGVLSPNCRASYRDKARAAALLPSSAGSDEEREAAARLLEGIIAPGGAGLFATTRMPIRWLVVSLAALVVLCTEAVAGPAGGVKALAGVALSIGYGLGLTRLMERQYGRHETVVVAAIEALGRLGATGAIPSLLGWLGTPPYRTPLQQAAMAALVTLEPLAGDDGADWLTPRVEVEITRRLRTGDDAPLARILGRVGGTACLPWLEMIAARHPSPLLRAAVKEELSAIRARAALQREKSRLLQPAGAPQSDGDQLLRPAGAPPEVDEQQLLRPGEGPGE